MMASTRKALELVIHGQDLRARLHANFKTLYRRAMDQGLAMGSPEPGPVAAIILPDRSTAIAYWRGLLDAGVYANLMIPPATPSGLNLLRISLSAAHSEEDVDRIVEALDLLRVAA